MSNQATDLEKGEGSLKLFEAQTKEISSSPSSPTTLDSPTRPCSQGTTIVGGTSLSSDDNPKDPDHQHHTQPDIWSRFTRSLRSPLGLKKTSLSQIPEDGNNNDSDSDSDSDSDNTIVRKIHTQTRGYPKLATFLDADDNFMIYRRFGYLQTRILLDRQQELTDLELQLDMLEKRESRRSATEPETECRALMSRQYYTQSKQTLLDTIETKLNAYSTLLSNASSLVSMNRPTTDEQRSVTTWLDNTKPLVDPESQFIRHREDLVTLRPGREHAWLDSGVERLLKTIPFTSVRRLFQSADTRAKSDGSDGSVLYTRSRIENFVVCLITLVILALLVVPIWILYKFSEVGSGGNPNGNGNNNSSGATRASIECIGVLLVSTLAFSACISLFTRAKRHETLAASAAYCAVLVVFFGNLGSHLT